MATHFRGPHLYARRNHPFNNLNFDLLQAAILNPYMGIAIGNGNPWYGPVAAGSSLNWTLTDVGTGASTLLMGNDGKLVLTGGTTDEDSSVLQFKGLPFRYSTTRDIACFARIALSTHNTTDAIFGLYAVDTTIITASAIADDDALGFFKAATATDYTFHSRINTTSTTQAMGLTLAANSYAIIGFTVKAGVIRAYAALDPSDSILTADKILGAGIAVANTNAPSDIDTLFTLGVGQEGGTTARTMTVDWAFCAQEID